MSHVSSSSIYTHSNAVIYSGILVFEKYSASFSQRRNDTEMLQITQLSSGREF